jgi:hypothetical protein
MERDPTLFQYVLAFLEALAGEGGSDAAAAALPVDVEELRALYLESAHLRLHCLRAAIETRLLAGIQPSRPLPPAAATMGSSTRTSGGGIDGTAVLLAATGAIGRAAALRTEAAAPLGDMVATLRRLFVEADLHAPEPGEAAALAASYSSRLQSDLLRAANPCMGGARPIGASTRLTALAPLAQPETTTAPVGRVTTAELLGGTFTARYDSAQPHRPALIAPAAAAFPTSPGRLFAELRPLDIDPVLSLGRRADASLLSSPGRVPSLSAHASILAKADATALPDPFGFTSRRVTAGGRLPPSTLPLPLPSAGRGGGMGGSPEHGGPALGPPRRLPSMPSSPYASSSAPLDVDVATPRGPSSPTLPPLTPTRGVTSLPPPLTTPWMRYGLTAEQLAGLKRELEAAEVASRAAMEAEDVDAGRKRAAGASPSAASDPVADPFCEGGSVETPASQTSDPSAVAAAAAEAEGAGEAYDAGKYASKATDAAAASAVAVDAAEPSVVGGQEGGEPPALPAAAEPIVAAVAAAAPEPL